jgi:SAM-dependent methyltransferase
MDKQVYFDTNRKSWDERVAIHRRDETGFYDVQKVLGGHDKLNAIEAVEIGDVRDLRIAHLQCHFGLDSICLARRGASVVGLDFAPAAIAEARSLSRKLGADVQFVEGNVYDARKLISGDFDMVYVTWGAINWLPDIAQWAKVVASLLKTGGRLYLAESHPAILSFDWIDGRIAPRFEWRTPKDQPIIEEIENTYTGAADILNHKKTYSWQHPLSDIINGLIAAGMGLAWLHEHAALTWPLFPNMTMSADGLYRLPADHVQLPLAFSLEAKKT